MRARDAPRAHREELDVILALLLISAPPAHGEVWAVVPVIVSRSASVDADRSRARSILEAALESRAGIRLASKDDFAFVGDRQLADRVAACGSDTPCIAAALAEAGADRALLAVVSFISTPPLMSLRVIDPRSAEVIASDTAPLAADDPAPWDTLRARTNALLDRAGYTPRDANPLAALEPPPPTAEAPPPTIIFDSPWFWAAAIAGVVLAASTAAVLLSREDSTCLCVTQPGRPCTGC